MQALPNQLQCLFPTLGSAYVNMNTLDQSQHFLNVDIVIFDYQDFRQLGFVLRYADVRPQAIYCSVVLQAMR